MKVVKIGVKQPLLSTGPFESIEKLTRGRRLLQSAMRGCPPGACLRSGRSPFTSLPGRQNGGLRFLSAPTQPNTSYPRLTDPPLSGSGYSGYPPGTVPSMRKCGITRHSGRFLTGTAGIKQPPDPDLNVCGNGQENNTHSLRIANTLHYAESERSAGIPNNSVWEVRCTREDALWGRKNIDPALTPRGECSAVEGSQERDHKGGRGNPL